MVNKAGIGVFARVGGEQAFLVGQNHQRVGFDQIGNQGAQRVVVAKLDLVVDHGVVLVDHRHHAEFEQGQQRGAGVQVALAVSQVSVREQHLRAAQAALAQLGFVHLRQAHLAHGGGGLQFVNRMGARGPAQALHAFGNGAAGHHDDFGSRAHQLRHLPAPFANRRLVQAPAFVGDQARADFDNNALGVAQHGGRWVVRHRAKTV